MYAPFDVPKLLRRPPELVFLPTDLVDRLGANLLATPAVKTTRSEKEERRLGRL